MVQLNLKFIYWWVCLKQSAPNAPKWTPGWHWKGTKYKKYFTHHGHWTGCVEKEIRYETEYTFKVGDSGGIGDWTNNVAGRFFNWIWNNFLPETCLVVLFPCGKIEGHRLRTHNGEFSIDYKQHILIYITISITAEP